MTTYTCRAVGCRTILPKTELFCVVHDRWLSPRVKRLLEQVYKPGRKPSQRFTDALAGAIEDISWWELNGQNTPRDVPLPLSDDEKATD